MWHLAPGLPGRRILRQKRKSVATKKRNAAVVKNENAVVDSLCDITIWTTFISRPCCLGLVYTDVRPYVCPSILYSLWPFTHVFLLFDITYRKPHLYCTPDRLASNTIMKQ